jgi:hypothetical protein
MIQKHRGVKLACLLVALAWSGAVHAQTMFGLTPGGSKPTGGQLQIGTGLPLPVGTAGIFTGGMAIGTAATFPPLFVLPAAMAMSIMQNQTSTMGGAIAIPAGVLSRMADGVAFVGVFNTNPLVYQVATTIHYSWPNVAAVLAPGGAPLGAIPGPAGGIISYGAGTGGNRFGGPAQFAIAPGPSAGTWGVPVVAGMTPIATVFLNLGAATPFAGMSVILVGVSNFGVAAQGAPLASPAMSTNFGPVPMAQRTINQPLGGGLCTMWCVGPNGGIGLNAAMTTWDIGPGGPASGPTNMATATEGFPFATGLVTISAGGAVPPEFFFAKGSDMRVAGVGNISLVAGALSDRNLSGPNANRAWISLPEPKAALGAAAALGVLGLCHSLLRRRSGQVRPGRGQGARTR